MATQVKHRRGSQSEINSFTPAIGEIVMNTSEEELVLGDGVTTGGVPIPKKSDTKLDFDSFDVVLANESLRPGYSVSVKERITGSGKGASVWDVVLASTVTPNGYDIVQCTGVTTLALVLRESKKIDPLAMGAAGDGVANDTPVINAAITLANQKDIPLKLTALFNINATVKFLEGMFIYGIGEKSGFVFDSSGIPMLNVVGDNVTLKDFKMYGKASGGIQIRANGDAFKVRNTLIDNVMFESESEANKLNQCVWLYGSFNTKIVNCDFYLTGYGVISQFGYVANDVLVDGCSFDDMLDDAVEANSGGVVISKRWTVSNCKYLKHKNFPYSGNEGRFVGTASVYGCVISNNTVLNAGGDSAIHIESNGGETVITGNTFKDCFGAQGNDGWIYLLNSTKDVVITDNMFVYEANNGTQSGISVSSSSITHRSSISNNVFLDLSGAYQFKAFSLKSVTGDSNMVISGNSGRGLDMVADMVGTKKIVFDANNFGDCNYGLNHQAGATGAASQDLIISNNYFEASVYAMNISRNSNGTQPPANTIVTGNRFEGNVIFKYSVDSIFTGNLLGSGFTIDKASGTRFIFENNAQIGVGPIT